MIHLSQEVTHLEVMRAARNLCIKLSEKVTSSEQDLKQTKQVYGKALTKLVKKVKHLEDELKSTTKRRKAKVVISHEEADLVSEDPSKQGRMSRTKFEDVETEHAEELNFLQMLPEKRLSKATPEEEVLTVQKSLRIWRKAFIGGIEKGLFETDKDDVLWKLQRYMHDFYLEIIWIIVQYNIRRLQKRKKIVRDGRT
ncbi:hypothetical protein Tco_1194251 [Tanacetum coccineum]